jgi:MFS family permease
LYFGWFIVAIAASVYMLLMGMTYSAFGLFVIPVSKEFGLSRANMNSALIMLNVGSALLSPFVGRMLDRFPTRGIMMVSATLFGLSFVGLALSKSLWLSAAILCLPLAAALVGVGTLTMSILLARWFTVQRGRAMMLAAMGMSLAGLVVTPIVAWFIENEGWRTALMVLGIGATAILLLLAAVIRERPGAGEVEAGGSAASPAQFGNAPLAGPARIGAILRRPDFWLIALGSAMPLGIALAIAITIVPLAIANGLTMMQATGLISVSGVAAITGKLLLSVVADKIDRFAFLTILFGLGAVLNGALLLSSDYATLVGCAVIVGITSGALAPLFYALVADRFGVASFGTVRGLMAPILAVNSALAVRLAGEVFDRTGGYDLLFIGFIFVQLLSAILICAARFVGRRAEQPELDASLPAANGEGPHR